MYPARCRWPAGACRSVGALPPVAVAAPDRRARVDTEGEPVRDLGT